MKPYIRLMLITLGVLLLLGSVVMLPGCKSKEEVTAEQNIRQIVEASYRGLATAKKIERLADDVGPDGIVTSHYKVQIEAKTPEGLTMQTEATYDVDPVTGKVLSDDEGFQY